MPGRFYRVPLFRVSVSAICDLVAVYAGTMPFRVHEATFSQETITTVEILPVRLKRLTTTVTPGSVGAALTPEPQGHRVAATVTARGNDTTQATTTGSTISDAPDDWNEVNGYNQVYNAPPLYLANEAAIFELPAAPAAARVISGWLLIEEMQ